ncbi:winged helix-turn-helix transcriptional regulator [Streptomyces lasiicapitis]|uniref:winged helix-turn-helix transcriptional regulator n=1 Tax=Streptomyces lasiicapitis TaxID=1923961 RepID=UPI003656FDFA
MSHPLEGASKGTLMSTENGAARHCPSISGSWLRHLASRLPRLQQKVSTDPTPNDERFLQLIHDFLHLLNGEWYWDVLIALSDGPLQYTRILNKVRASIPASNWPGRAHRNLQESTLSRTLLRLVQSELIERERATRFPFATTYRLTPPARELLFAMKPVAEWTETHCGLLVRAQQRRRGAVGE